MTRRETDLLAPTLSAVDTRVRHHRCTICGKVAPWSDDWSWWGSVKQLDDAIPVVKICSEDCNDGLDAATLASLSRKLLVDPEFVLAQEGGGGA